MPKKRTDRKRDRSEIHEWHCKQCGAKVKVAAKHDIKTALMVHALLVHS